MSFLKRKAKESIFAKMSELVQQLPDMKQINETNWIAPFPVPVMQASLDGLLQVLKKHDQGYAVRLYNRKSRLRRRMLGAIAFVCVPQKPTLGSIWAHVFCPKCASIATMSEAAGRSSILCENCKFHSTQLGEKEWNQILTEAGLTQPRSLYPGASYSHLVNPEKPDEWRVLLT